MFRCFKEWEAVFARRLTGSAPKASTAGAGTVDPPIPATIYRGATKGNLKHVSVRPSEEAVSFRDSQSNPLPSTGQAPQPVLKPGGNYIGMDTSKLPAGSVIPDGVPYGPQPAGHVSVTASTNQIVEATVEAGKYPK